VVSATGRRPRNEDAAHAFHQPDGSDVLVVADGMGGHKAGDVASRRAVDAYREASRLERSGRAETRMRIAFDAALRAVRDAAGGEGREGMGTTLVAAEVAPDERITVLWAGDSPAVLVLRDEVRRLSDDHTVVGDALRSGALSEVEALRHPFRHAVTRALGTEVVEPEVRSLPAGARGQGRALLLLGSDGLFGALGDAEILEETWAARDPNEAVVRLVLRAIRNGSNDNTTAAAVGLGPWSTPTNRLLRPALAGAAVLISIGVALYLLVAGTRIEEPPVSTKAADRLSGTNRSTEPPTPLSPRVRGKGNGNDSAQRAP
jgi:protein phosphatase